MYWVARHAIFADAWQLFSFHSMVLEDGASPGLLLFPGRRFVGGDGNKGLGHFRSRRELYMAGKGMAVGRLGPQPVLVYGLLGEEDTTSLVCLFSVDGPVGGEERGTGEA